MGKRIGILTGGGDCPGLNAVIRAAVKVGVERHGFEVFGIEDAFSGLIDLDYRSPNGNRWLTPRDVRDVLGRGGTLLGTSNRNDPFHFVTKDAEGRPVERDVSDLVVEHARAMRLDGLISIGGDGSMAISQRLLEKGLPIVGVPKTIDNDLGATDQTFGFDTAVGIATEALDRLRDTAESHDRVMLLEVMGRDAGFIALHAGMAGGADAILIPEIPYAIEPLVRMVQARAEAGQKYSLIVVSEGAKPLGGDVSALGRKPGEMVRLKGAAARVEAALEGRLDAEVRVTVLGHLQRGGVPSSFDRILASRFGRAAAELCAQDAWGRMVALRDGAIVSIPIADAVARPRRVDPKGDLLEAARALGTVFGDEPA